MSWILKVREKFQAAHYLKNYKGKCENIHGHTFIVEVDIRVHALNEAGIGIDFTEIKERLHQLLPDHTLLNDVYDFNPSAENLSRRLYQDLKTTYPVENVTVWESEDASATYTED